MVQRTIPDDTAGAPPIPTDPLSLPSTLRDKRGGAFTLRRYAPDDRRALEAMYTDFAPKRAAQGLPPDSELGLRRWLERVLPHGAHLVVDVDGDLMGHGFLAPLVAGTANTAGGVELANFLHQAVRGRGIGTALNHTLLALARDAGHERVWLSVEPWNRAAVRSYEKAGFTRLAGSLWAPEIEMAVTLRNGR